MCDSLFSPILFRPFNKEITKARAFTDKMPFEKRIKHSIIWKWHRGWMPVRRGLKPPFAWAKSRLVCKASSREWIRDSRAWILKKFQKPWTGSSRYVNVCFVYINVYVHHTKKTSITNACIPLHLISTAIWGLGCQDVIHGAHTT